MSINSLLHNRLLPSFLLSVDEKTKISFILWFPFTYLFQSLQTMGKHRENTRDFHFNWRFFRSCYQLGGLVYPSWEWAALLTVITIATAIGSELLWTEHLEKRKYSLYSWYFSGEVVNYFSGLNLGKFYGALVGGDEGAFWTVFVSSTLWYVALCGVSLFFQLFRNVPNISTRKSVHCSESKYILIWKSSGSKVDSFLSDHLLIIFAPLLQRSKTKR